MSTCTKCFIVTEKCQVCELEARNAELERLADNACMDWHFKCEALEKKLKIAVEALEKYENLVSEFTQDGAIFTARQALAAIKGEDE